jgi:hypothetical protein
LRTSRTERARLFAWAARSLAVTSLVLVAPFASAQSGDADQARANELFQDARTAFLAGDYAKACPKYEEVVRLRPGLGARVGLGDCYRKMGRLARAWEVYRGIANDAPDLAARAKSWADGSTARKRGKEAETRLAEIEPHLGWITIAIAEPVAALPNLAVHLDGVAVDKARLGVRLPAERGEHVIDASAPGKRAWEKSVAIAEGAELTVAVQALDDEGTPAGPVDKPKEGGGANPPLGGGTKPPPDGGTSLGKPLPPDKTEPIVPKDEFFSTQRKIGLGLGIVGVGAVGVGAYFGLRAWDKRDASEVDGHCEGNLCDEVGLPLRRESYQAGKVSTGLFIGGGVVFATGLALFLTAPKRARSSGTALIVGPSAILWTGRF